jgi:hypothetical protein
MKRNGMVMTAVAIKIGRKDVGSILIPNICKKGSEKQCKSRNHPIPPNRS